MKIFAKQTIKSAGKSFFSQNTKSKIASLIQLLPSKEVLVAIDKSKVGNHIAYLRVTCKP
jgi:hypothetical protein